MFPKFKPSPSKVFAFGDEALGAWILEGVGLECFDGPMEEAEVVLITNPEAYFASPEKVNAAVQKGAMAVLLSLPVGAHKIGSYSIEVHMAGMGLDISYPATRVIRSSMDSIRRISNSGSTKIWATPPQSFQLFSMPRVAHPSF